MKFFLRFIPFVLFLLFVMLPSFTPALAAQTQGSVVPLVNPIGGSAQKDGNKQGIINVKEFVGKGLTVVLGIMGSLTLLAFIFGGYMWLTSAGNDEKVRTGANTLLYATIGLFIIFGAYAILNTILKGVAK